MAVQKHAQSGAFDLLSQPARQRLRARVADAGGDTSSVAREIRAQIEQLDDQSRPGTDGTRAMRQAERAFFVAQLSYLDVLAQPVAQQDQPAKPHGIARIWSTFTRQREAK